MAGFCEHGNEYSFSIKGGEFLDYLSILLAPQEGLCCMQVVRNLRVFEMDLIGLGTNGGHLTLW
jgi:hypothetical protein